MIGVNRVGFDVLRVGASIVRSVARRPGESVSAKA